MEPKRRPWTAAEVALLRERFADSKTADLAAALNRPYMTVAQKASALGLRKSPEYLAGPRPGRLDGIKGMGTRFQPGLTPWNKGQHFDPGGRSAETRFKPGRSPQEARNYVPIGTLRLSKGGYLERKVTDDQALAPARRWVGVHRLVWIEAHGPVPDGHAVCFKPGRQTTDPDAITPDALELVTRGELMRRNTHHRYGKEVAALVQLRGAITRQINKRAKEES
jgi:hypothetical protein